MMPKQPVLLTVLIDPEQLRWHLAGIDLSGGLTPLLCSAPGSLKPYLDAAPDEQLNFLRHRLSGVLQRGCDRLWSRDQKPCQVVFLATREFRSADPALTRRVAEHFVDWMTRPPVAFFLLGESDGAAARLEPVAGELPAALRSALEGALPELRSAAQRAEGWEVAPTAKESAG